MKRVAISSTMGPGVQVEVASLVRLMARASASRKCLHSRGGRLCFAGLIDARPMRRTELLENSPAGGLLRAWCEMRTGELARHGSGRLRLDRGVRSCRVPEQTVERSVLRARKAEIVDSLRGVFSDAGVIVVTHYQGLIGRRGDRAAARHARGRRALPRDQEPAGQDRARRHALFERSPSCSPGRPRSPSRRDPVAAPKAAVGYAKPQREADDHRRRAAGQPAERRAGQGAGRAAVARRAARQAGRPAQHAGGTAGRRCCRRRAASSRGCWRRAPSRADHTVAPRRLRAARIRNRSRGEPHHGESGNSSSTIFRR